MTTTKVFQNGNSQALRIPAEMRATQKDYLIQKIGEVYIAYPASDPWAPTRMTIGTFPDDLEREPPDMDDMPEREAL